MDQQAIEKIQRRAITKRLIPDLRHLTYQERLSKLSLPSLYFRRQRGEMIFLYQITHQYFNVDVSGLFEYQSASSTRGHGYKIYKPHAKYLSRVQFLQFDLSTTGIAYQHILWTHHLLTYLKIL